MEIETSRLGLVACRAFAHSEHHASQLSEVHSEVGSEAADSAVDFAWISWVDSSVDSPWISRGFCASFFRVPVVQKWRVFFT